jgi:4-oxalocrotonate tautomerase
MPFVNIRTAKGLLDEKQKAELHSRLTDLLVEIEGRGQESFRPLVWIMIEEEDPTNWSLGGNQVTAELVAALAGSAGD